MAVSEQDLLSDLKKCGFRPKKTTFGGKDAWEFAKGVSEMEVSSKLKKQGWKQTKSDIPHGAMSGTDHLEKDGTGIQIYGASMAKTRIFFASEKNMDKTAGKYPLVEMAAEPVPIEKRPYSLDEFLKVVKGKMFYDPKTFDRKLFTALPKQVQDRIYGKWNARFPSEEATQKAARIIAASAVKISLLERAAENAFQNKDIHLANALYTSIEAAKLEDPFNVPVEGPDLDPAEPEESNAWATDASASAVEDALDVPVEGADLDPQEPEDNNVWAADLDISHD